MRTGEFSAHRHRERDEGETDKIDSAEWHRRAACPRDPPQDPQAVFVGRENPDRDLGAPRRAFNRRALTARGIAESLYYVWAR
jgi:hypothetical protein